MLDVLCPLITESDIVSNELLDIILMNVVEPNKSQRKNAYLLAKELVVKCSDTLEPYIQTVGIILYTDGLILNYCVDIRNLQKSSCVVCITVLCTSRPTSFTCLFLTEYFRYFHTSLIWKCVFALVVLQSCTDSG